MPMKSQPSPRSTSWAKIGSTSLQAMRQLALQKLTQRGKLKWSTREGAVKKRSFLDFG